MQEGVYVSSFIIDSRVSRSNVQINVESLAAKPADIAPAVTGKVFNYFQVTPTNIADADINKATIKFHVDNSWLAQNNIDPANVRLYRYSAGSWNALPTTKASEDTLRTHYNAETPGFSVFAIAGETISAQEEQPAGDEGAKQEAVTGGGGPAGGSKTLVVVVIVLVLVAVAYVLLNKKSSIYKKKYA